MHPLGRRSRVSINARDRIAAPANAAKKAYSGRGSFTPTLAAPARLKSLPGTGHSHHLVLAYRPGWQSIEDLCEIAQLVRVADGRIGTFILPANSRNSVSRKDIAARPTLIVSPGMLTKFRPLRGRVYQGFPIPKFEQLIRLHAAGIPVPLTTVLTPDLKLDPAQWGEFVVIKPTDMSTSSHGTGISLCRTERVRYVPPAGYPAGHPGRNGPMLVQRYVDTGERVVHHRVLTLFDKPLYLLLVRGLTPRVQLDAPDQVIEAATIAHQAVPRRERFLVDDPDILALARAVHGALPEIPLKGCDILRDATTGKLFVLEVNPGGNTWHFSSELGEETRRLMGPEMVKKWREQFQAFRTAAAALVERTLAESA